MCTFHVLFTYQIAIGDKLLTFFQHFVFFFVETFQLKSFTRIHTIIANTFLRLNVVYSFFYLSLSLFRNVARTFSLSFDVSAVRRINWETVLTLSSCVLFNLYELSLKAKLFIHCIFMTQLFSNVFLYISLLLQQVSLPIHVFRWLHQNDNDNRSQHICNDIAVCCISLLQFHSILYILWIL